MAKKDIQTKIREEMPEFAEACQSLDIAQLNARLAQNVKDIERVQEAKDADAKLQDARDEAKQYALPYSDAKKALKMKAKYILILLKERGDNK